VVAVLRSLFTFNDPLSNKMLSLSTADDY